MSLIIVSNLWEYKMKLFKAYTGKRPMNYNKMVNQLELKLIEINQDADGPYMLLTSLNGAKPKDLEKFKGIKNVYLFEEGKKENYFKLLVAPNRRLSYNKIVEDFDLNLVEIGTSSEKNFWNKKYPFMVFKSNDYLHPDQLKKYKNVEKVEILENYKSN